MVRRVAVPRPRFLWSAVLLVGACRGILGVDYGEPRDDGCSPDCDTGGGGSSAGGSSGAASGHGAESGDAAGGDSSGGSAGGDTGGSGGQSGGAAGTGAGRGATGGTAGKGGAGAGGTGGSDVAGIGGTSGSAGEAGAGPTVSSDGLVLWLRADLGVSESQGFIEEWSDQSPAQQHATQSVQSRRPRLADAELGDLPAVDFDGTDDQMILPIGFADFRAGLTFAAVVVPRVPGGDGAAFLELSSAAELDDVHFGLFRGEFSYEVELGNHVAGTVVFGSPQLIAMVHGGDGTATIYVNGELAAPAEAFALPAFASREQNFVGRSLFGENVPFAGAIGELLLYARPLDEAERIALERYLSGRFGCCD